jgi:hypothetical protein
MSERERRLWMDRIARALAALKTRPPADARPADGLVAAAPFGRLADDPHRAPAEATRDKSARR